MRYYDIEFYYLSKPRPKVSPPTTSSLNYSNVLLSLKMKKRNSQPLKEKNSQIVVCLSDLIQLKNPAKSINLIHRKRLVAHRMGGYSASLRGRGIDFSEV